MIGGLVMRRGFGCWWIDIRSLGGRVGLMPLCLTFYQTTFAALNSYNPGERRVFVHGHLEATVMNHQDMMVSQSCSPIIRNGRHVLPASFHLLLGSFAAG